MQKVAVYCRVSTDKDDQANSFESQQRYFRDYIDRQPDWELANIYADEGLSGTSTKKRAAFNRMINDANLGKFDIVITKEVSRFSRNILDTISYTRELRRKGIGVLFANDGINTLEPDSELRLSIMGSIAQEESRKTSTRVKWGQTRRMEQGVVFGRSMLGYDVKNGMMTVNPSGAEIVKLIFYKYVEERKGTSVIARELREAGYKTYTGSPNWTNSVILKILRNEKYCGDLCQKKTYTPDYLSHEKKYNYDAEEKVFLKDHHEAIIDRKLWDRAQKELVRRDVGSNVKIGHGNRYALSGKIKCGECGATFVSRYKTRKSGSKYKCWRCGVATAYGTKKIDQAGNEVGCNIGRQIRDEIAMHVLKQSVDSLLIDKTAVIDTITDIVTSVIKSSEQGEQINLVKLEHQLETIIQKKKSVLDAFFSQSITKEEMRMMTEQYDSDITELTNKLNMAKQKQGLEYSCDDMKTDIAKKVEDIVYGKTDCENFYGNLLDTITVFSDQKIQVTLNLLPTKWTYVVESLKQFEKYMQMPTNPVIMGVHEDVAHSVHDVLPPNATISVSTNAVTTEVQEGMAQYKHDIPISVSSPFTSPDGAM
ncbi:recombinase family protein [Paludicola sp. MB14-C6]|uniref:recombinase family protein n=1 Tax=Paludihabitans sp. MB14-C6 TaxID=3070656 RepID=UPI0027DB0B0D|nr:recombinase family protein [Paludicola sp. MB14-C6]WMJ22949.1 recombinase family protein [Paludicola sp. MB14-C6]